MIIKASAPSNQASVDPVVKRWTNFIENLQNMGEIPEPFEAVNTLARQYLAGSPSAPILDIGCETGKNAIPLIRAGHKVTLLDIAPNAIFYTQENLERLGLKHGIADSIVGKIEDLNHKHGPFKAVVGTYTFSFIPPHLFEEVMKNNVLGRIDSEGYFAGGFFGEKHAWKKNPRLSFLSQKKLEKLFSSMGFSICEMKEKFEEEQTQLEGKRIFHTIEVIAKKNPPIKIHQIVNTLLGKLRAVGPLFTC